MLDVNEKNFEKEVEQSKGHVLVFFYRESGCSYCDKMKPIVDEYQKAHPEVKVVKYKLGSQPDSINAKYPIERFPTFYAFIDGVAVGKQEGAMPLEQLHLTFDPDKIPAKQARSPQQKGEQIPLEKASLAVLLQEEANMIDAIANIKNHYLAVKKEIKRRREATKEWDKLVDACCDGCADGHGCEGDKGHGA